MAPTASRHSKILLCWVSSPFFKKTLRLGFIHFLDNRTVEINTFHLNVKLNFKVNLSYEPIIRMSWSLIFIVNYLFRQQGSGSPARSIASCNDFHVHRRHKLWPTSRPLLSGTISRFSETPFFGTYWKVKSELLGLSVFEGKLALSDDFSICIQWWFTFSIRSLGLSLSIRTADNSLQ